MAGYNKSRIAKSNSGFSGPAQSCRRRPSVGFSARMPPCAALGARMQASPPPSGTAEAREPVSERCFVIRPGVRGRGTGMPVMLIRNEQTVTEAGWD